MIVDELAHTNIEGSKNEKRWQDVTDILEAGISVITAVNIQHLEGLNEDVQDITGIEIKERIPDSVLEQADEVVNIDLTADELVKRLRAGKIYKPEKIQTALNNFFKSENILQLRELALKEVALRVEKKVENAVPVNTGVRHEKFLACISSQEKTPRKVIRKAARLATATTRSSLSSTCRCPAKVSTASRLANQQLPVESFQAGGRTGRQKLYKCSPKASPTVLSKYAAEKQISTVCIGKPAFTLVSVFRACFQYRKLLNSLSQMNIDLIILA